MLEVVKRTEGEVARPLKVLVPLIKQDFDEGERAGMAHFRKAGEKLNEAHRGHFQGDTKGLLDWAEKTFKKKREQLRGYMASASPTIDKSLDTITKVKAAAGIRAEPSTRVFREWTAPVDGIADRARNEARRLAAEDSLSRQQERQAEAKLGLRLIDIGFKVLALEFHPDKMGGTREAMTRLNRVRDRLKANV